jgi:hypothetical protein
MAKLRGRAKITSHSAAGSQAYRSFVGRHSILHAREPAALRDAAANSQCQSKIGSRSRGLI